MGRFLRGLERGRGYGQHGTGRVREDVAGCGGAERSAWARADREQVVRVACDVDEHGSRRPEPATPARRTARPSEAAPPRSAAILTRC